jgi:hypothetical protein
MKLHKPLFVLLMLLAATTVAFAQSAVPSSSEAKMGEVNIKGDVKTIIKGLGRQLELSIVFDESVKGQANVEMKFRNVTIESVLQTIFTESSLRACWTEDKTILVYADTPELRERFAQYKLWEPKSKESK